MKYFLTVVIMALLGGCSYSANIGYDDKGTLVFNADKPFTAEYEQDKDGNVKAKINLQGQPLINLQPPNLALKN